MANICTGCLHARGEEQRLECLRKYLFGEMDKIIPRTDFEVKSLSKKDYGFDVCFECAWSVATCMTNEGLSYGLAKDCGADVISIEELSELLGVDIEIWSEEPGMGIEEHFVFINGKQIEENICVDTDEYGDLWGSSYFRPVW